MKAPRDYITHTRSRDCEWKLGLDLGLAGFHVHTQPCLSFLHLSPFHFPFFFLSAHIFFLLYKSLWPPLLLSVYHSIWIWASHFIFLNHLTSLSLRLLICQIGIITVSSCQEQLGAWSQTMDKLLYKVACYNDSFFLLFFHLLLLPPLHRFLPLWSSSHTHRRGVFFLLPLSNISLSTERAEAPQAQTGLLFPRPSQPEGIHN